MNAIPNNHEFGFSTQHCAVRAYIIVLLALGIIAFPSVAASQNHSLFTQYQQFTAAFWDAEKQLQIHDIPLSSQDNLYQKYFYVDQQVGRYLSALHSQNISESWTIPHALYLGGVAAFTIGDYNNAQKYFSRLLKEYPNYKRDSYISDNYNPDPQYSQPAEPGVSKLLFYCEFVRMRDKTLPSSVIADSIRNPENTPPAPTFQQFNQSAVKVLLSQRKFADWLANRPHSYQRRDFYLDEDYGETPDQLRASALPKTSALIQDGWDTLFAAALKKDGVPKMREHLRELAEPDSPLQEIAASRLAEVDQLVIKHYFAQAKVLLRRHKFAATRKKYRQIITEYPDSDASRRAEKELPKVVPVAVNYYKEEGDKNWNPVGHIGVPQTKSREFYEKMYKENPDGSKADYALYYWASALGTEGDVKQEVKLLQEHLHKFPTSKWRSKVMYELGFVYGSLAFRDYNKAVKIMDEVVQQFPNSDEAPEALFHASFYLAWNNKFEPALERMQQMKRYPKSFRAKWVPAWIKRFEEKIKNGGVWP